jgi:hypothetical protein
MCTTSNTRLGKKGLSVIITFTSVYIAKNCSDFQKIKGVSSEISITIFCLIIIIIILYIQIRQCSDEDLNM